MQNFPARIDAAFPNASEKMKLIMLVLLESGAEFEVMRKHLGPLSSGDAPSDQVQQAIFEVLNNSILDLPSLIRVGKRLLKMQQALFNPDSANAENDQKLLARGYQILEDLRRLNRKRESIIKSEKENLTDYIRVGYGQNDDSPPLTAVRIDLLQKESHNVSHLLIRFCKNDLVWETFVFTDDFTPGEPVPVFDFHRFEAHLESQEAKKFFAQEPMLFAAFYIAKEVLRVLHFLDIDPKDAKHIIELVTARVRELLDEIKAASKANEVGVFTEEDKEKFNSALKLFEDRVKS